MDARACEYIQKKDWVKAAEVYSQLLTNKQINRLQAIIYLDARAECFRELGQYEAVIVDCRKAIQLLNDCTADVNDAISKRNLLEALVSHMRFAGGGIFFVLLTQ